MTARVRNRSLVIALSLLAIGSIDVPAMATSTGSVQWTVFDFNPSTHSTAPRVSATSGRPNHFWKHGVVSVPVQQVHRAAHHLR